MKRNPPFQCISPLPERHTGQRNLFSLPNSALFSSRHLRTANLIAKNYKVRCAENSGGRKAEVDFANDCKSASSRVVVYPCIGKPKSSSNTSVLETASLLVTLTIYFVRSVPCMLMRSSPIGRRVSQAPRLLQCIDLVAVV
jgi:hypothetical protein